MRKFVLHCFRTHTAAQEALRDSDIPGKKRATSGRIDSDAEAHLFRKVVTLEDAHQLAGMVFQEIHADPATDRDARNWLQSRLRYATA